MNKNKTKKPTLVWVGPSSRAEEIKKLEQTQGVRLDWLLENHNYTKL